MVKLIKILPLMFLLGCTCKPIINTEYVEKKVPVYVYSEPPMFERPSLEIFSITEETLLSESDESRAIIAKAYVVTIKQLQQYVEKMEQYLQKERELAQTNK